MKLLIAISIGPVQEFIAAARRCRDLWYGSYLLSELSKAAALALRQAHAELIFPAPVREGDLESESPFTAANKLVATVETSHPELLIEDVKRSLEGRLDIACQLDSMKLRGTTLDEDLYYRQLRGTVEFYAAWTVLGWDYGTARKRVDELLAARKALRDFPYYEGKAGRQKSSLDGARESVVGRRSKRLFESNLKGNEHLDALGIVKRFARPNPGFDSTVDVAALPFVKGCRDNGSDKRKAAFRRYQGFLQQYNLQRDTYSLLYEHESRQIFDEDEAATEELKDIRAVLGRPNPPYYALLLGDGDKMGQTISALDSDQAHREFSSALSGFADKARIKIDKEYGGCSIYCGGDDVMALLPLDTALEAADAVNRLFEDSLKRYGATFSAGIAIAHGLEPLNEVRAWAAEAEHRAKSVGGRNAVCISAYARSGAPVSVCGKWDDMTRSSTGETGLLLSIVELYTDDSDALPRSLGYELRDMVERLKGWPEMDSLLRQMVLATVAKKECSEEARRLIDRFAKNRVSIERLYGSMLVARWFARAKREARGDAADHTN